MNKSQFLEALRKYLSHLKQAEIDDIIRDQEEYIQDAINSGRSETEVIRSLGDPKAFASSLSAELKIHAALKPSSFKQQMNNTFNATIAIIALTPLNILFVLVPLMAFVIFTIVGWTAALGILITAFLLLLVFFFKLIFLSAGLWTHLAYLFFSLGCIGLGLLALFVAYKMTHLFLTCVISYLKWNLNFIKGKLQKGESYEYK